MYEITFIFIEFEFIEFVQEILALFGPKHNESNFVVLDIKSIISIFFFVQILMCTLPTKLYLTYDMHGENPKIFKADFAIYSI